MGRGGRGGRVGGAASDGLCCSGATDGSAGVLGVGEGVLAKASPPGEAMGRSNKRVGGTQGTCGDAPHALKSFYIAADAVRRRLLRHPNTVIRQK